MNKMCVWSSPKLFAYFSLSSLSRLWSFSWDVIIHMRKLCPNIDRDDGLETVLEVPIPEEMFTSMGSNVTLRWQNMLTWMKAQTSDKWSAPVIAGRFNELRFLLYLVGSPLIPLQVQLGHSVHRPVRDSSIVRISMNPYHFVVCHQSISHFRYITLFVSLITSQRYDNVVYPIFSQSVNESLAIEIENSIRFTVYVTSNTRDCESYTIEI